MATTTFDTIINTPSSRRALLIWSLFAVLLVLAVAYSMTSGRNMDTFRPTATSTSDSSAEVNRPPNGGPETNSGPTGR